MCDSTSQAQLLKHDMNSPPPYDEPGYLQRQPPYNPTVLGQMPPYPTYPPPASGAVGPINPAQPPSPMQMPLPTQATQVTSISMGPGGPGCIIPVGPNPMQMRCHLCGANIRTVTNTTCKSSAHTCCCLLFFLTCGICSCLPYCMKSYKKVNHKCPNCEGYLGTYVG